jgi:hypothetical protein
MGEWDRQSGRQSGGDKVNRPYARRTLALRTWCKDNVFHRYVYLYTAGVLLNRNVAMSIVCDFNNRERRVFFITKVAV